MPDPYNTEQCLEPGIEQYLEPGTEQWTEEKISNFHGK
jgi:hypothetical protein